VVKRDGAWQALDGDGDVRFASADWLMAVTFALVAAEPFDQARVYRFSVDEVRRVLNQWRHDHEDESDGGALGSDA